MRGIETPYCCCVGPGKFHRFKPPELRVLTRCSVRLSSRRMRRILRVKSGRSSSQHEGPYLFRHSHKGTLVEQLPLALNLA